MFSDDLAVASIGRRPAALGCEDARNLRNHILPALGRRKVRDITKRDVERLHGALRVERQADGSERATPFRANRVTALLSKMFALAEEWDMRPTGSNPCRGIKKAREHRHERFLSSVEIARLWEALAQAETDQVAPEAMVAGKLGTLSAPGTVRTVMVSANPPASAMTTVSPNDTPTILKTVLGAGAPDASSSTLTVATAVFAEVTVGSTSSAFPCASLASAVTAAESPTAIST